MVRMALDMHCDTLMKLSESGGLDGRNSMVTLRGLQEGGVALQCFADFVPTGMYPKFCRQFLSEKRFQKLYRRCQAMMARHRDVLFPVLTGADVGRAGTGGKIGVLLTIEDGGVLGDRLENVQKVYDLGVRLITLTWNHPNAIGFPHSRKPVDMARGLTFFGREVVREMERLGIVVDVSHCSDGVFRDVAEMSSKPFVASHSNARAVCGHTRNMTDEMIRTLADKGGVMGLNLGPEFLQDGGRESKLEDMVRQVLHIRNVGGSGVLALGSDFDGISGSFEVKGPQDWPKLADALLQAGLSEDEVEDMWFANAARVLCAVLG